MNQGIRENKLSAHRTKKGAAMLRQIINSDDVQNLKRVVST